VLELIDAYEDLGRAAQEAAVGPELLAGVRDAEAIADLAHLREHLPAAFERANDEHPAGSGSVAGVNDDAR
jgi:hypothetical protein